MFDFLTRKRPRLELHDELDTKLSGLGLSTAVFTQKGQLVLVQNEDLGDHHFYHETHFRAYIRLYLNGGSSTMHPFPSPELQTETADNLPGVPNARVIKWICAASEGFVDNFVIYWNDTVVENYQGSGYTAEFRWQPTDEVIEDLYREDVEDHIAWWNPTGRTLSKQLERGLAKKWIKHPRGQRAMYEEDMNWGCEM